LREFAFQRQQELLREIRLPLIELAVQRTVAEARLASPPSPQDLARLQASASEQLPPQLMGPLSRGEVAGVVQRLSRELGSPSQDSLPERLHAELADLFSSSWLNHTAQLDSELAQRGAELFTRLALEELLAGGRIVDPKAAQAFTQMRRWRQNPPQAETGPVPHHGVAAGPLPDIEPVPGLAEIQSELTSRFASSIVLWRKSRADLAAVGGELDMALQVPGWANVWTMPIQNRVDMLSTGVNTDIGICVLGPRLDDVAQAAEEIAAVVKKLPGAAGVVADPIRGKGYLDIRLDRQKAAQRGVDSADANVAIAAALGGIVVAELGSQQRPLKVRLAFPRSWREDADSLAALPVPADSAAGSFVPLAEIAELATVEGPATLKGENGELRSYVRLNVRGRDAAAFVADARRAVEREVRLPEGVHLAWTGQFQHQQQTFARLAVLIPAVVLVILLLLWWTYHDLADALLVMLAVPGAIAGGVLLQWLLGETLSITVLVGYIACFGMATATGVIMLVYLREAVDKAGGLDNLTLPELRQAVLDGAVHRLRPKLLTEATTIIGLAPMLWASGVGSEVIRPMVVPVLGGILIADEVIDLFLPVMFYWVRRRRWLALRAAESRDHAQEFPVAA
jgi:Cu(I)/Ag(I) efflux system membrane protein CusA/SilA